MNFSQDTISYLKNLKSSFCSNNNNKSNKSFKQQPQKSLFSMDLEQLQNQPVRDVILSQNKSSGLERIINKKNKFGKFLKNKINFIRSLSIERRPNKEIDILQYADKIFQIFKPDVLSELNDIIHSPNIDTLKYILPYLLADDKSKTCCIEKLKNLKHLQNENTKMQIRNDNNSKILSDSKLENRCSFKDKETFLSQDKKQHKIKNEFSDDSLDLKKTRHNLEAGDIFKKPKNSLVEKKIKEFSEPIADYFSLESKSSFINNVNSGDSKKIDKRRSTFDDVRHHLDRLKISIPLHEENNYKKAEKRSLNFETPICKLNHFVNFNTNLTENKDDHINRIKSKNQFNAEVQNSIGEQRFGCCKKTSNSKIAFKRNLSQHSFYDSKIDQCSQNNSSKSQSKVENIQAFKDLIVFDNQNTSKNKKSNKFVVNKSNDIIYESAHSTGSFHSAKTNSEKDTNSSSLLKRETDYRQKSKSRDIIDKNCSEVMNERHSDYFNKIPFCLDLAKSSEDRFTSYYNREENSIDFTKKTLLNEKKNFNSVLCENKNLGELRNSNENSTLQKFLSNSRDLVQNCFSEKRSLCDKKDINKEKQNMKSKNHVFFIYDSEASVASLSSEISIMNTAKEVIKNESSYSSNKGEDKINSEMKTFNDDYCEDVEKNDKMIKANIDNYFCSNIWRNINSNMKKIIPSEGVNLDSSQMYPVNEESYNLNLFYEQNFNPNGFLLNIAQNHKEILDDNFQENLVQTNNCFENETSDRFRNSLNSVSIDEELNRITENLSNSNINNNNNNNNFNYLNDKIEIFKGEQALKSESKKINLALLEIDEEYKANLFIKNRPSEIELMNNEELIQEKTILEKILFQLEWNFGWNTILYENENFLVLKRKYELVRTILEGSKCKSCGLTYYPFNG
jgi:hypothetical protein